MIWLRIGSVVALIAALWAAYAYIDQRGYDRCKAEMETANLKLVTTYANQLAKAEGERDANQIVIDKLTIESRSLHVHFPVCPTAGAENSNGTAGILSKRMDESFARLQERGTVLFERCEALNADAIKVNAVLP